MTIYEFKAQYTKVGEIEAKTFRQPSDIANYLVGCFDEYRDQEQFWIICLNGANQPICRRMITLGLANQTQVHAREVFRVAIAASAVSVVFAHNHPSGCIKPSPEDLHVTDKLVQAGKLIGIDVLDHLIIAPGKSWQSIKVLHPHLF